MTAYKGEEGLFGLVDGDATPRGRSQHHHQATRRGVPKNSVAFADRTSKTEEEDVIAAYLETSYRKSDQLGSSEPDLVFCRDLRQRG